MNQELNIHPDVLSIIQKTAALRGVTVQDILSSSREKEIITAKFISIYITRNLFDYGTKSLAKMYGYKQHTAILHACNQVTAWMQSYSKVREIVTKLEEETLYTTMTLPHNFQIKETVSQ